METKFKVGDIVSIGTRDNSQGTVTAYVGMVLTISSQRKEHYYYVKCWLDGIEYICTESSLTLVQKEVQEAPKICQCDIWAGSCHCEVGQAELALERRNKS